AEAGWHRVLCRRGLCPGLALDMASFLAGSAWGCGSPRFVDPPLKAYLRHLRQNWGNHISPVDCRPLIATIVEIGAIAIIQTKAMEDRGVDIVNMDAVFHRV